VLLDVIEGDATFVHCAATRIEAACLGSPDHSGLARDLLSLGPNVTPPVSWARTPQTVCWTGSGHRPGLDGALAALLRPVAGSVASAFSSSRAVIRQRERATDQVALYLITAGAVSGSSTARPCSTTFGHQRFDVQGLWPWR